MSCPFCQTDAITPYAYPLNHFNNKQFQYVRCKNCELVYLNRFPDQSDYEAMYPPSYQNNVVETIPQQDPYLKLPGLRFDYGYQFDLVRKFASAGASILDYGCGTGHFISTANHFGFTCDGAEFNPEYVSLLQSNITSCRFYTIDDVLAGKVDRKYDVIRLSNVLEHLTAPKDILEKLAVHLKPGGIFLIEGPIEDNFCLATAFKKAYFKMQLMAKRGMTVSEPPYHIFFSNKKISNNFSKIAVMSNCILKLRKIRGLFRGQ